MMLSFKITHSNKRIFFSDIDAFWRSRGSTISSSGRQCGPPNYPLQHSSGSVSNATKSYRTGSDPVQTLKRQRHCHCFREDTEFPQMKCVGNLIYTKLMFISKLTRIVKIGFWLAGGMAPSQSKAVRDRTMVSWHRNSFHIDCPSWGESTGVTGRCHQQGPVIWRSGPRLNIKTVLSTYGDFHVKDKTAVRTSYL